MERRVLAAIALSIGILFLFRYYEEKRMMNAAKIRPPAAAAAPQAAPPPAAAAKEADKPTAEAAPAAAPADTQAAEKKIRIDGSLYSAVLDNRGGVLTSWILKDYHTAKGADFEMIAATHFAETRPFPGSLQFDDAASSARANGELYEARVLEGGSGETLAPPAGVEFKLRRGDLVVTKKYHFLPDNYLVEFDLQTERAGRPAPARVLLGQDIGPEYEHLVNPAQMQAVFNLNGSTKHTAPPKEEGQPVRESGSVRWAGIDMHYFAIVAIPAQPFPEFEREKRAVRTAGLDQQEVTRDLLKVTVPFPGTVQMQLYVGPKKQSNLEAVRRADLSGAIDYGMFSFIVRPLLASLKWLYGYIHNYGVAIIILTFLLTLILFPFRIKQILSMKKMAVVQPKIKEIQERYKRYKKTDPKRAQMNQEVMAVYKQHGVNPLGGCLPLILQMPFLFAFYQLLAASIELRQAPFFGWMQDLSHKDPYYVLPVIMGITMLISQKMTPPAPGADPVQAKMMMVMPAIFTVMFLNVSSGLNLYFLCSNIFSIAFQKIAERWIGDGRQKRRAKPGSER